MSGSDYSTSHKLFDYEGSIKWEKHLGYTSRQHISENGKLIVIDEESSRLTAYNREGDIVWKYQITTGIIQSWSASRDGRYVAVAVFDYMRWRPNRLLLLEHGETVWDVYRVGAVAVSLMVSPNNKFIVLASWAEPFTFITLYSINGETLWLLR